MAKSAGSSITIVGGLIGPAETTALAAGAQLEGATPHAGMNRPQMRQKSSPMAFLHHEHGL